MVIWLVSYMLKRSGKWRFWTKIAHHRSNRNDQNALRRPGPNKLSAVSVQPEPPSQLQELQPKTQPGSIFLLQHHLLQDAINALRRPLAPSLSLQDVYDSMDAEQRASSRQERHKVIEYAQKRAANMGSIVKPPDENQSMVCLSRCPTAASRKSVDFDCEIQSVCGSEDDEPLQPPPNSVTSRVCSRVQSAVDRDSSMGVRCLSRQCCDVLGPTTCHECAIIIKRKDTERHDEKRASFPNLYPSQENISTALLVSRACPKLNSYDVQSKIVCGNIFNPGIKNYLERRREALRSQSELATSEKKKVPPKKMGRFSAHTKTAMCMQQRRLEADEWKKTSRIVSFSEIINPLFVSRRQLGLEDKEPVYKAYYEPPLLPKAMQAPEPPFLLDNDDSEDEERGEEE
ncbi:hypothetical protein CAPTEDRAFT_188300 [Capitella teleta]|uniref:Uncharacterized protein n=1 Tax=Capitella teleta TaxID=283909 RepID=R7U405_CAPTE|nr:hypothetical protein CAPTEDRAFT_188300 [Capitella teleta]|eukprot:ELT97890.1 hypothetical protein CAPTEDRAFT_188300 [Capitella teleta]